MKFIQATATNKVTPVLFVVSDTLETVLKSLILCGIKEYTNWRDWERVSYQDLSILSEEDQANRILLDSKQDYDIYKYIKVISEDSVEHLIIFPKYINHSDMYNELLAASEEYIKPISAGFTNLTSFSGRSETLNLDSLSSDKEAFV